MLLHLHRRATPRSPLLTQSSQRRNRSRFPTTDECISPIAPSKLSLRGSQELALSVKDDQPSRSQPVNEEDVADHMEPVGVEALPELEQVTQASISKAGTF